MPNAKKASHCQPSEECPRVWSSNSSTLKPKDENGGGNMDGGWQDYDEIVAIS